MSSNRKPNLIETDRGKEFYSNIFRNFLKNNNTKTVLKIHPRELYLLNSFFKSIKDLPKRPVFEKGDGKWIDVLPAIMKQYSIRVHNSTKLTPIQASLKENEANVYHNLLDK